MGNKDDSETKVIIRNEINTEIQNTTSNINKILNETMNTTVSNIVQKNATEIKMSTSAGNTASFGDIELTGDVDIDISQKAIVEATSKAIISLVQSTEQLAELASQMQQDIANKLKNDSGMKAAMDAAAKLKEAEKQGGGPEQMVDSILKTVKDMTRVGGSSSNKTTQDIKNSIMMKIKNTTINENNINNIVKNHIENNITKVNASSCNIDVSGSNVLTFSKIKASGNAKLKVSQELLITAFNDCVIEQLDTTTLTTKVTDLKTTKSEADTANISKVDSELKAKTELEKTKEAESGIMKSVDNLVDNVADVSKSAIAGSTIILIVGVVAVGIVAVIFLKSGGIGQVAAAAKTMKRGGGFLGLDKNSENVIIVLLIILIINLLKNKN